MRYSSLRTPWITHVKDAIRVATVASVAVGSFVEGIWISSEVSGLSSRLTVALHCAQCVSHRVSPYKRASSVAKEQRTTTRSSRDRRRYVTLLPRLNCEVNSVRERIINCFFRFLHNRE